MRILVVDESASRGALLREGLESAGHEVIATLAAPFELARAVDALAPEVIVIDTDSPTRDTLEHLVLASRDAPRPIIMFSADRDAATIRDAMRAGVSAYVVDGVDPERVQSIVDVAVAQFDEFQKLKSALAQANRRLSDRKVVEQAKGRLMRERGLSEADAYTFMRKVAMSRKERLAVVAQRVLEQL